MPALTTTINVDARFDLLYRVLRADDGSRTQIQTLQAHLEKSPRSRKHRPSLGRLFPARAQYFIRLF